MKLKSLGILTLILFSVCLFMQGCLKDSCRNRYTLYRPIYKKLSEIRAEMKLEAAKPLQRIGKIYVYNQYIFINEINKGIHIINNSNPTHPQNTGFISIPGNVDIAVKDNYLYADSYSDIVVLDITNPASISPVTFLDNVLKEYGYYWGTLSTLDSVNILVDYIPKDTVVDCETAQRWDNCPNCQIFLAGVAYVPSSNQKSAGTGTGGSLARFSIVNDYLYGVTTNSLYALDISDPAHPNKTSSQMTGWNIETIYPFRDKLFIGSTTGMYIFDISNPSEPHSVSMFTHAKSCDPVIADDKYAYETLRSGTRCQGTSNELDVLDVTNLQNPLLLKTYSLNNPYGLAKDGKTIIVCDGSAGLKIFNDGGNGNLQLLKTFGNIETYDVIASNSLAVVIGKDGLYEFDYSNPLDTKLISHIP
ncbi:MAG: LVIVD repeat-containing protein, partial [Flavisolibacter sp.]